MEKQIIEVKKINGEAWVKQEVVFDFIDEDIKIQKEHLKNQPENRKSIEWRITGMEFLRRHIEGEY